MSSTRWSGTRPSKPQPNALCTLTWTFRPAAWATRAVAMMRRWASSLPMPVFLRLWVFEAETPMQTSSTPQARARSRPFSFSTSPDSAARGPGASARRRNSSSVSAICGTFPGWTKEPTWTRSTPDAMSARIQASLTSVGTTRGSTCRPSRGPTSWMMISGIIISSRWPRPSPG
jgi:hypothetical protein